VLQQLHCQFLTLLRRYDLYATVNHIGSIDGGHYIAYMQVRRSALLHSFRPLFFQLATMHFAETPTADGQLLALR
jgi:hypothetical protein